MTENQRCFGLNNVADRYTLLKPFFFFEKTKQKQNNPPLFQTKSGSLLLAPERQYIFCNLVNLLC